MTYSIDQFFQSLYQLLSFLYQLYHSIRLNHLINYKALETDKALGPL